MEATEIKVMPHLEQETLAGLALLNLDLTREEPKPQLLKNQLQAIDRWRR